MEELIKKITDDVEKRVLDKIETRSPTYIDADRVVGLDDKIEEAIDSFMRNASFSTEYNPS